MISVIIIFLNAERFIEEAIESVFDQNYGDWELLLVDDGSSDASSAIARRYTEQHPEKVYYFEHAGHENRGMSASRNLGGLMIVSGGTPISCKQSCWISSSLSVQPCQS